MRAAVVLCLAVMAMSASAYREYARTGALEAGAQQHGAQQVHGDDAATRLDIATRKATCPFVGSSVAMGLLPVTQHNPNGAQPLAKIETVVSIGNTPVGSTLGHVLAVFSTGNHAKMLGADGKLSVPVPADSFALDFPGSQGAHAGHSGILMADPQVINSGRWSQPDWQRLVAKSQGGLITTQQLGAFIGENVAADPKAHTLTDLKTIAASVATGASVVTRATALALQGAKASPVEWRAVVSELTKLAALDNLIGSAGEFGLLLAFLEHSPTTVRAGGNAFAMADIQEMFQHKKFPAGWESWPKSALAWAKYSTELTAHARIAYNSAPKRH